MLSQVVARNCLSHLTRMGSVRVLLGCIFIMLGTERYMHYIMGIWVFVQGGVDRWGGLPSWMIAAAWAREGVTQSLLVLAPCDAVKRCWA